MTKVLHIVPEFNEANGMFVVARMLAGEDDGRVVEAHAVSHADIATVDEVWVHGMWLPCEWRACKLAYDAKKPLVRILHGSVDPVRLKFHGWKKWLVGPIERFFLRRCKTLVATCEAEKGWIRAYLGKCCPQIEVTDIKRFFKLPNSEVDALPNDRPLHLLYLGRKHPLKGLEYLEEAVKGIDGVELRVASNAFGEEKERVWKWCDVLVLPTLSDNFGLVIAEALERGKRVITTDGAPAWGDGNDYGGRLIYLKGYRDGTDEIRVRLLKDAIEKLKEQ